MKQDYHLSCNIYIQFPRSLALPDANLGKFDEAPI